MQPRERSKRNDTTRAKVQFTHTDDIPNDGKTHRDGGGKTTYEPDIQSTGHMTLDVPGQTHKHEHIWETTTNTTSHVTLPIPMPDDKSLGDKLLATNYVANFTRPVTWNLQR